MKRRYKIWLICFAGFSLVLPFFIDWLYRVGQKYPIIRTGFSQGEALGYITTVIAAALAITAIFLEETSKSVRLLLTGGRRNTKEKQVIKIKINNIGHIDCTVVSVALACKTMSIIWRDFPATYPYELKAKKCFTIEIGVSDLKDQIKQYREHLVQNGEKNTRMYILVLLATDEGILLDAKNIISCL